MRTPDEVARDANALVPWRRIWTIVGVVLVALVALLIYGVIVAGEVLAGFKALGDWIRATLR